MKLAKDIDDIAHAAFGPSNYSLSITPDYGYVGKERGGERRISREIEGDVRVRVRG